MLTPSKKLVDSPLQTPSPVRRHIKCPRKNNKENYGSAKLYHLIPDDKVTKDFIWIKKEQKLNLKRKHKSDTINYESRRKDLLEEHRKELEGIKKRKFEGERLHEKRMREKEEVENLVLAGEFENWEKEEHAFMLLQAKNRTKIRLRCGRPQPIDLLVQYKETVGRISSSDENPLSIMAQLNVHELKDLLVDITVYKEIEGGCIYWNDLEIVVKKYIKEDNIVRDTTRCGINSTVVSDVSKILIGKSSNQLLLLRSQIQEKLKSDYSNVDVSFWESLLDSLQFHLSETRLHEMNRNSSPPASTSAGEQTSSHRNTVVIKESTPTAHDTSTPSVVSQVDSNPILTSDHNSEPVIRNYIRRSIDIFEDAYSPEYLKEDDLDEHVVIHDPEKDSEKLELARQHVRELYSCKTKETEDDNFREGETNFTNEYILPKEAIPWISEYTPRKPRYFNRLQTGFTWNRYNRTHYDIDNPPPKTVMGYRFNIYYPDLIDKCVTPTYEISACEGPGDRGLSVLRFRAGPPYEDLAFKIVDREWDRSERRGYRCWFNGRVLELWFRFKRMCYRR